MIILSFPQPARQLNLNDRSHWATKAQLTKAWRHAAHIAALDALNRGDITRNQPFSIVQLSLPVRSLKVRRDPGNWAATTKPVLDGIVQSGLLEDDDSTHVATMEPRFHLLRDDPMVSVLIRCAAPDGVL